MAALRGTVWQLSVERCGNRPAIISKRVSDRYGADIPFYDLFRANAGNVWDFTGNNPDTQTVREIFYTGIHDLLMGKTTPEECAAFLDERCNAAIDEGWAKSQLHE